jgi:AcrR family transcriptional regulator
MNQSRNVQLREKKKADLKRAISQIGIKLFIQHGFEQTLIEHIVDPLNISKRTFFRYFNTKEDVVFSWYEQLTKELITALKERPSEEDPFQSICESLLSLLKYYDADPKWAISMMRLSAETPGLIGKSFEKRSIWEHELVQILLERFPSMTKLQAKVLVGSVMNAFVQATQEWFLADGKYKLRPIIQKAFTYVRDLQF